MSCPRKSGPPKVDKMESVLKKEELKSKKKEVELSPIDQTKPRRSTEQERISELEKQLAISRQREQLYLRVIEISSEELGEDLLKKTGIGCQKRQ